MTLSQTAVPRIRRPLRLWPGVVAAVLLLLAWFVLPAVVPDGGMYAFLGGIGGAFLVFVWWLFFSRAPWLERLGVVVLGVAGVFATRFLVDRSIANGMMGMMLFLYSIPALAVALVASAVAASRLSSGRRRAFMAAAILVTCGAFAVVRTGGITGGGDSDLHWRWTATPEERLLAAGANEPSAPSSATAVAQPTAQPVPLPAAEKTAPAVSTPAIPESPGERARTRAGDDAMSPAGDAAPTPAVAAWPGFRGSGRDSVIRGVRIETDWSRSAPVELWRRPVGPGWSSFAINGNSVYTQEQRGEDELVSCYDLRTGKPVWRHRDAARFWESNAGAGPRATPTFSGGRLYTFGATGILNSLDARTGSVVWSRSAASDTGAKVPNWGFAGSPLLVGDAVVVATGGVLAAYDVGTGRLRWVGPTGAVGYSSPQLATIDGVEQILLLNSAGAVGVAPGDGKPLWQHAWAGDGIVQPSVIADGGVLIGSGSGLGGQVGMCRLSVAHSPEGWKVEERWTSIGLKPYFNDFVVHKGHAFGFDGGILSCVDLEDGKRKWKGGRYGHGQLILLADQDLLLVLSEEGDLALVAAATDQFTQLARVQAIEGKTWNHPVLAGDVLLVRNGEEMAAFRLRLAGS